MPTQRPTSLQRTSNSEAYEHYLLGMDIFRQDRLQTSELATAEFQKAIALDPDYANACVALAIAQVQAAEVAYSPLQRAEEIKQAFATIERAIALAHFRASDEAFRLTGTAMVEHTLGYARESDEALDALKTKYAAGSAFQVATAYAWRGEKDDAFEWPERAYEQHDSGMARLRYDPTLVSLQDDPRFAALVKKMDSRSS